MNKKISIIVAVLAIIGILFFLLIFIADNILTCTNPAIRQQTYTDLFNEGNSYLETGNIRGFLSLYQMESIREKECYQLAIRSFSQALAIDSTRPEAFNNRAFAYARLGQYEQALADYQTIFHLNPQDDHVLINMATVYEESGQLPLAIATYEQVIIQMEQSEYWKQLHPERVLEYREKLAELREQAAEATP